MPSITITFPFEADAQGFTDSAGTGLWQWEASGGNPGGRMFAKVLSGTGATGDLVRTGAWTSYGVPVDATVVGLRLASFDHTCTWRPPPTQATALGPLRAAGQVLAPQVVFATTTDWLTQTQSGTVTGLSIPAANDADIRLGYELLTTSPGQPAMAADNIALTVDYTLPQPVLATLAATESGADTAAMVGEALVLGALNGNEIGADVAAAMGQVRVTGTLGAMETGVDTAAANVTTGAPPSTLGTMAAVETGADSFAGVAGVEGPRVLHMAVTEAGGDNMAGTMSTGGGGAMWPYQQITDHDATALSRYTHQYSDAETLHAITTLWAERMQALEDAAWAVLTQRWVEAAVGQQLTELGEIVGEPRLGRGDAVYREAIGTRITINRSGGEPEMLIEFLVRIAGAERVQYREMWPAAIEVFVDGSILPSQIQRLREIMPAGVGPAYVTETGGDLPFGFSELGEPDPIDVGGFGELGGTALVSGGSLSHTVTVTRAAAATYWGLEGGDPPAVLEIDQILPDEGGKIAELHEV